MEGGAGRLTGWQGRWSPTCVSLCMESPKPGAGSWVTQVAMSHLSLPSPLKLLNWDLLGCSKEFSKDLLQSIPMLQACPETSLVGGWDERDQLFWGLHSRRVIVVGKGDSPG